MMTVAIDDIERELMQVVRRRVRQQLGDIPVFFTLVDDEPIQTFWMRSPKLMNDQT